MMRTMMMVMVMMMNRTSFGLRIQFKGNFPTHVFPFHSRNPFTQLGFLFTHHTLASNSSSINSHCSRSSMFEKVTNLDDALKSFHHMKQTSSVVKFTQMLNVVTKKMKHLSSSVELFKQMRSIGVPVNEYSMSIALLRLEEAKAAIDIMVKRGMEAHIDGCCLRGDMTKAREIFDSMAFRGLEPDIVTYNSLLNGYCKNQNFEESMHIFREMTRKGLKPDIVTYNTLIQGLFQAGRCADVRELFNEMHARRQFQDECTYGIILKGLCNNQVGKALMLLRLVGYSKLNYDIVVYASLIDGACKSGKLDIAKDLFRDLADKGLRLGVWTYDVMISGLCRGGFLGEAKLLFLEMEAKGYPPNNVAYNVLLQGYLENQHYDDVEMVLLEMDGRGYSLDASTFSRLLDQINVGSLQNTSLGLIGKLVPKEWKRRK